MLPRPLVELAEECGVSIEHVDGRGERHLATPERLVAVLAALDVPIAGADERAAAELLAARRAETWSRLTEPCAPAFADGPSELRIRVPAGAGGRYRLELALESGERLELSGRLEDQPVRRAAGAGAGRVIERAVALPPDLPFGYHEARIEAGGRVGETFVIAAPARAFAAPGSRVPGWGVFAPLYALRSERNAGIGDLGDLAELAAWVDGMGGHMVGTLPLLGGSYDEPFEASPYSPITRLFWNELYADLPALARELACEPARALLASVELRAEATELRSLELVDYRRQMALVRRVLELFSDWAWERDQVRAGLEAFAERSPRADDYARFRAEMEARRATWPCWPAAERGGDLRAGAGDERVRRYHLFVQAVLDRQLARFDGDTAGLYLDLPVGVSGASYDVWRERSCFVSGADVGAPPDDLFAGGQNWALPPLHPERQRRTRYRYLIDCVRHHMRHARLLRIDHVMGLHRLYWIPAAAPATEGLYVRYPADELYAIFTLESARGRCAVAGEDLGTVPDYVRPTMARRGFHRLYVAQFTDQPAPSEAVASLGTHDTATFAGFLAERGVEGPPGALLREWTLRLAESRAAMLLVTLEDLWLETEPQNVPGPDTGRPNWRRKMSRPLAALAEDEASRALLLEVARRRKAAGLLG